MEEQRWKIEEGRGKIIKREELELKQEGGGKRDDRFDREMGDHSLCSLRESQSIWDVDGRMTLSI